jgi:catecholate siderophore receptor
MKKRWIAMGAMMASATLTTRLSAATEPPQAPRAKTRYDDAIADVLARRRPLLTFPPSWELALAAVRRESIDDQKRPAIRFDIPAGPLRDVLAAFERVTNLRVRFRDEALRDIQSPGLTGVFTPEQALERLLAGTGTGFTFSAPETVTIDVAGVREFVAVTGHAPSVSSPKLPQRLRDIPQTIAVIPKEVIQEQNATSLRDVLRNVPGITFQAGEGGGGLPGDNFSLRGFSAGNDMFVDGVRDSGGYSRDTFNLEQLEVAKGPSGSISGRGTTGGAINQVTKSPAMDASYDATVAGGTSDSLRGTLDVNQPIGAEERGMSLRLNAMWGDSGVPGRDVVENHSWAVAPAFSMGIGAPTQITIKSQHLRQDNVPDYGLPWGVYPGFPTGAFQADPPVDQTNFYGLRNYDFEDIRSNIASGEVRHRFEGGATLRNITRYSDTERDSAITAPRPPNRQLQRRTMGNENIANQTNLNLSIGRGAIRHDVVTGVEVARETTSNRNSAQSTNQPSVNLVAPNPNDLPLGPMPANTGNPSNTRLDLIGVYAFDTLRLGERWQLTAGARWDAVDVDYRLTTLATGEVTELQRNDEMLSWRGAVTFKPSFESSLYLASGTSFNPAVEAAASGAALSGAPTAANSVNLEPEKTRSYEAGGKWDALGGRLSLNAAVFRTEKVNARTRNLTNEPFVLAGKQRVDGIELGAAGSVTNRWSLMAAYAFMDSEIAASANPAETGNDLTLTPEQTFSLWTTYRFPRNVTVGGGAQYMDAVFRNTVNTTNVPSYWLVNGLASYDINEHLTLRVNLQNLTDKEYVDRVGGGHYIPGPRRQATFSTDIRF